MGEQVSNAIGTDPTLNGAIITTPASGTQETWTLSATGSGSSLPQRFPYMARIDNSPTTPDSPYELVKVTAHPSSTTATVIRGMGGTATKAHDDGAVFRSILTSGGLLRLISGTQHRRKSGFIAESFSRSGKKLETLTSSNFVSGRLHVIPIELPANELISSITFFGAAAPVTPTNQWFTLLDDNRNHLRSTVNDTTTAWAANTPKSLALSSPLVTTYAGLYFCGILVTAATMMGLVGVLSVGVPALVAIEEAPASCGTSSTGLTTPPADGTTAAVINASVAAPYCGVS